MPLYELDDVRPQTPLDHACWVAPGAHIVGRVKLGSNVTIWFGAVLRGDNEWITIGDGTNVQENCVLHTDLGFPLQVGNNCVVGHQATLHGCTIADQCLIGMGAIVLNGAAIGRNSVVGAGALVTEGKEFPANSLIVGSPARLIRTRDDASGDDIAQGAKRYQANLSRYKESLTPIQ